MAKNVKYAEPVTTNFGELKDGEMFIYQDKLHMKLNLEVDSYNCVNIEDGCITRIPDGFLVILANVDIIVKKEEQ